MTESAKDILEGQLKVVRTRFINLLDERLDEVEVLYEQIERGEEQEEALKQIQFIVHKIGGTASTLGFPDTGDAARSAEDAIIQYLSSGGLEPAFNTTMEFVNAFLANAADVSSEFYWN